MKKDTNLGYRILVVDDEPTVRRATALLLKHDGNITQEADCGETALAMFEPGKFDLVITDNSMGQMSGGQLAALIKKRQPDQLVVMATAFADSLEMADATAAGVDFILYKPFTWDELKEVIAQVMSREIADLAGDPSCGVIPPAPNFFVDRPQP